MKSREQRLITKEYIAMHTNLCKFTLVITYCARPTAAYEVVMDTDCVFKFT